MQFSNLVSVKIPCYVSRVLNFILRGFGSRNLPLVVNNARVILGTELAWLLWYGLVLYQRPHTLMLDDVSLN